MLQTSPELLQFHNVHVDHIQRAELELHNTHPTSCSFTLRPSSSFYVLQPTSMRLGPGKSQLVSVKLHVNRPVKIVNESMAKNGVRDWIFIKVRGLVVPAPTFCCCCCWLGCGHPYVRHTSAACPSLLLCRASNVTRPFSLLISCGVDPWLLRASLACSPCLALSLRARARACVCVCVWVRWDLARRKTDTGSKKCP